MPDMLVKLYDLPEFTADITAQRAAGVDIRRAIPAERHLVVEWVAQHFSQHWVSECHTAFSQHPTTCFIAVENGLPIGFACYDATAKGFFGPTGVDPAARGRGIGKALLLICLHAMAAAGYGYAVIGAAGPTDFYSRAVGATIIEDSSPGVYRGMLRKP